MDSLVKEQLELTETYSSAQDEYDDMQQDIKRQNRKTEKLSTTAQQRLTNLQLYRGKFRASYDQAVTDQRTIE